MVKTEKEIREEIELATKTIENHLEAYKEGKIDKDSLEYVIEDSRSIIGALRWVLGENDRYD